MPPPRRLHEILVGLALGTARISAARIRPLFLDAPIEVADANRTCDLHGSLQDAAFGRSGLSPPALHDFPGGLGFELPLLALLVVEQCISRHLWHMPLPSDGQRGVCTLTIDA